MIIKKIYSDEVINEVLKEANGSHALIFYGAGHYGKMLRRYIIENMGRDIDCFAVSNDQDPIDYVDGKEVKKIDETEKESVFVITVSEQKQGSLISELKKKGVTKVYTLLNDFLRYIMCSFNSNKLKPQLKLSFEIHLVDYCNLNCKGCYHFSPLALEKDRIEPDEFKKDCSRMKELFGDNIGRITLIGGEPLMHPEITEFVSLSRLIFPESEIYILTNGTLLPRMSEDFWNTIKNCNVVISVTKYPIDFDYQAVEKEMLERGVRTEYHNDIGAGEKMLIKFPMDLEGKQDPVWNFRHCWASNTCVTLKHGKIYTCPMAAHAHLLKDYFKLDMDLSENNSLDIYAVDSMIQITEFLAHPIPFCSYCSWKKRPEQIKWDVSKKRVEEWV